MHRLGLRIRFFVPQERAPGTRYLWTLVLLFQVSAYPYLGGVHTDSMYPKSRLWIDLAL